MSKSSPDSSEQQHLSGVFIPLHAADDHGGLPLGDWYHYLLTRKWLIAVVTIFVAVASTVLAFLSTPVYRAEVLLAPNSDRTESSLLSGIAGQFDTLSSITRLDLGDDLAVEEAIATLKSREFTVRFIHSENLLPILFAAKWDAESNAWNVSDPDDVPSDWDAYEIFDTKIREVSKESNGLIIVHIDWRDRELAATWANRLVTDLNEQMRRQAIEETSESIAYLQKELQSTSIVELKTAISRLIEAQVKKAMLARARDQYSFRVIDPAVAPDADKFVKPNRLLMVFMGTIAGLILGIAVAFATRRKSGDTA